MSSEKEGQSVIPLTDFEACALGAPTASLNRVDMPSVSLAYLQASAAIPSPCKEVFRLLGDIAGIHLNPAERARVGVPGISFGGGRSMIPSDIRGEQSDVLEAQGRSGRDSHRCLLRLGGRINERLAERGSSD
jgi:hypothetical protein